MKRKTRQKKKVADPVGTRERILTAAVRVFAEHGFKDATTRVICAAAEVNVALVNYYFRSKAELYQAVITSLFENTGKPLLSLPDTVSDEASWRLALRTWVRRALAICAAQEPPDVWVARLMGMEACVPSELAQDIEVKFSQPVRQALRRLFQMALPEEDDPSAMNLWASSTHAQCVIFALTQQRWAERYCPKGMDREAWLERVADHICEGIFARLSFRKNV
jgi:AcrR family transcriptional regulator